MARFVWVYESPEGIGRFFFLGFLSLVVKLTKSSILSERKQWTFVGETDYKFYHTPSMVCVVENHVRD